MHHDNDTWKDPKHFIPESFESYPSLASTYAASEEWDERDHYDYVAAKCICPGKSSCGRLPHPQEYDWQIQTLSINKTQQST